MPPIPSREEQMAALAGEIRGCRKCPLWKTARHAVPGEGSLEARLMLVGEAPGEREDASGRPFVGRAGSVLNSLLQGIGLAREDVFIGNVVKHRPPGNRDPRACEIEICSPYLDRQIDLVRPEILVTLGRHSARYVLARIPFEFERITDVTGSVFTADLNGHRLRIVPALHPAAGLYNPSYRKKLEEEFRIVQRELERPSP